MRTAKSTQETIQTLLKQRMGIKTIAKILKISKNTVRKVKQGTSASKHTEEKENKHLSLIRELYRECKGNGVRIQEILEDKYDITMGYSTLTRTIREAHLRKEKTRAGTYHFDPAEEMQHDTSPHRLQIGEKKLVAQCASLVFTRSRMLFIQYFPRFTRFEAKSFIRDALHYFDGACGRCMVDNTAVVVVKGSGSGAVFAPELVAMGKAYGFEFRAHEVGDANRSAHVERNFHYVENNFLAGREFRDWKDLNEQARSWCDQIANMKEKRAIGMTPKAAFLLEKPHLKTLPTHIPPVYDVLHRLVDNEGFVNVDTNRYSVPERLLGKKLEVFKYPDEIHAFFQNKRVAKHNRVIGIRQKRVSLPEHHRCKSTRTSDPCPQEVILRGKSTILDDYLDGLKLRSPGRGARPIQKLLHYQRTYPEVAFMKALETALSYGLYDLVRLESIILKNVANDFFQMSPDAGGEL